MKQIKLELNNVNSYTLKILFGKCNYDYNIYDKKNKLVSKIISINTNLYIYLDNKCMY